MAAARAVAPRPQPDHSRPTAIRAATLSWLLRRSCGCTPSAPSAVPSNTGSLRPLSPLCGPSCPLEAPHTAGEEAHTRARGHPASLNRRSSTTSERHRATRGDASPVPSRQRVAGSSPARRAWSTGRQTVRHLPRGAKGLPWRHDACPTHRVVTGSSRRVRRADRCRLFRCGWPRGGGRPGRGGSAGGSRWRGGCGR